VAATMRMSMSMGREPPTRSICFCSTARRSLGWRNKGMSPISSSMTVPCWASSNLPFFWATAPVNAPRSWPNSSDSRRFSGMAAQLTLTHSASARGDRAWMASAITSLPAPDSPVISTVESRGATRRTMSTTSRMPWDCPTMAGHRVSARADLSRRSSRVRARRSSTRRMTTSISAREKGLEKKSQAPRRTASRAFSLVA